MESLDRSIQTWVASGSQEKLTEITSEIAQGNIKVLDVVKSLREYLTSEEDQLRTKGVEFLSLVLGAQTSKELLNRQSVRVLTTFYCDKLDDTATTVPALSGLVSLSSSPSCSSNEATAIVEALFAHVRMKALVQSVRFSVFSIIDALMARHREALKHESLDFVKGYLTLAEGEKDPRNLLVAFAIARVILIEFDITKHIEDLFNITYCYFPITFRPPPNDPYGITTDDLKNALRACLNGSPHFGPLAIPVFLEKLTAGSPSTKRDTLKALSACLPVFGAGVARGSARKLWNSLKLEIFQPTDPITEQDALLTMQVLVKTIYADNAALEEAKDLQGLARDACEECIKILQEPEKSQAKPAIKVICAFLSTTPLVSKYTIYQVVPHLVKIFLDPDETSNRSAVLTLLSDVISAARDSSLKESTVSEGTVDPFLMPFKDEILGVMTVGLKTTSSRRPAIDGLKAMVTTKASLLTDEELGFIVHNINDILQADPDDVDDAIDPVLDLLSTISNTNPRHVEEQTLPLLFSSLPDRAPARDAVTERSKYWRILSALGILCLQSELFETLIIRLTTKLDLICVPAKPDDDPEPAAAYAHSILITIAKTLESKVALKHADVPKYLDRLVSRLYNLFIYSAISSDGQYLVGNDPRLVVVAARIIRSVTQTVSLQKLEVFATGLFAAYFSGNVKALVEGQQKIPEESVFYPFAASATPLQKNLVSLFSAAVVTFHKELKLPVENLDTFLTTLVEWTLSDAENEIQREAAWHTIGSIVNKQIDSISSFLSDMLTSFWPHEISDVGVLLERRQKAINVWIWVSKALLVRNHTLATQFTDRLFDAFDDVDIGWDAARALGEIAGVDAVLVKHNHAVTKILYAQRFFNSLLPRITMGAKDASKPREQIAHLVALASLIKSTPKTAYVQQLPSLIPLLLRGLELPDSSIRASVIDTFLAAAENDSPEQGIIAEHSSTLVSIMLKNSMLAEMPSMRVRVAAVKYLGILPSIVRYDVLHPYKANVLKELSRVLDDPKRAVRKEAVDARTNWFKYTG